MRSKSSVINARNRHAINPLMKKGGCHQKTRKAQRQAEQQALCAQLANTVESRRGG